MPDADESTPPPTGRRDWPQDDANVDVNSLVLRIWRVHQGDSDIVLARPRKGRGAPGSPPPTSSSREDRTQSANASTASWRTSWRCQALSSTGQPAAISPRSPFATKSTRGVLGASTPSAGLPLQTMGILSGSKIGSDYVRHVALNDLLGECDGVELTLRTG